MQGCVGASWDKAPASRSGDVLEEKEQEGLRGQALPWEQSHPSARADKAHLWDSADHSHPASVLSYTQCDGVCGGLLHCQVL